MRDGVGGQVRACYGCSLSCQARKQQQLLLLLLPPLQLPQTLIHRWRVRRRESRPWSSISRRPYPTYPRRNCRNPIPQPWQTNRSQPRYRRRSTGATTSIRRETRPTRLHHG